MRRGSGPCVVLQPEPATLRTAFAESCSRQVDPVSIGNYTMSEAIAMSASECGFLLLVPITMYWAVDRHRPERGTSRAVCGTRGLSEGFAVHVLRTTQHYMASHLLSRGNRVCSIHYYIYSTERRFPEALVLFAATETLASASCKSPGGCSQRHARNSFFWRCSGAEVWEPCALGHGW